MRKAVRAIVIENNNLLVMHRSKNGIQYFTLVGGRINDHETPEQALVREVQEETELTVTSMRMVYIEEHPAPYNEQYIYLCEVAPHAGVAISEASEEAMLNKLQSNLHEPQWVSVKAFPQIAFRTPLLQNAIALALKKGFPTEPVILEELPPTKRFGWLRKK
ncbi:MAG TPA: NUDIX hydrolase [Candidatus Saccharimonadales bacterium]|nr:NUDIX hydrolase [Candidatus Saccharimonadales bacterium]